MVKTHCIEIEYVIIDLLGIYYCIFEWMRRREQTNELMKLQQFRLFSNGFLFQ